MAAFALCLTIGNGCKKDIASSGGDIKKDRGLSAIARMGAFADLPTVQNGRLVFRDSAHFNDYSNYLSEAITIPETEVLDSNNAFNPNVILAEIESSLGFTSLRETSESQFEALDNIGWNTIAEIPERHFIKDITTLSVLNSNAEVVIGSRIYYYHSKDYLAAVDDGEEVVLTQLHNLSSTATFSELQDVDPIGSLNIIPLGPNSLRYLRVSGTTANDFYVY